ncbi:MAG: hypothetical protein U1E02_11220, partial [Hydrogenophaga sp.]|nr:hypothetical protein [Hydrogenophaga sp.]
MSQATGYFTHKDCWRHEMGNGHPECPQRLDAIEDRLLITGLDQALERREATAASMADMELAHGRMHLASLRSSAWSSPVMSNRSSMASRRCGHSGCPLPFRG